MPDSGTAASPEEKTATQQPTKADLNHTGSGGSGDIHEYLHACYGDLTGRAHAAIGRDPYVSDKGKYEHRRWQENNCAWPDEGEALARTLAEAAAEGDVYVCPYLMWADKRTPGGVVHRILVHADADDEIDPQKVRDIGGFAVASGTPGHAHVYVPLSEPVPGDHHKALCRALGVYLGAKNLKVAPNDLLRPPDAPQESPSQSEDCQPILASRLLTRSDLRALPAPEPLIDGVLDAGTVALLYGYRGSLKSFIALDWATSVARKRPWQGRNTEQRRGLYIAAEGAHGYPGRFDAWETGWGEKIEDGQLDLLPWPVNLMVPAEVANLGAFIEWGGYGFVVFDTLARCMAGGDESSSKDMGLVVDRLYWLLEKTPDRRGLILPVHHTGKDQKTLRGSSALDAGVDTVYSAVRDGMTVALNREKLKDGPELDNHVLALDPIPGTDSCTLRAVGVSGGAETPDRSANLRLIVSQHFVSTGATGTELRRLAVDEGTMSRASYYRAMSDLLESGYLVNVGTDQRPFYKVNQ